MATSLRGKLYAKNVYLLATNTAQKRKLHKNTKENEK
jgi:hypothetical protein